MNDPISATASAALAHTLSPVELFLQADFIVKTVIVLLLLASAWGWTVIAEKLVRLASCNRARQSCSRASRRACR